MKKNLRWTPEELEQLSLHELADLMANIVLVLRRMPDVPVSDLMSRPAENVALRLRKENTNEEAKLPDWAGDQNGAS